MQRIQKIFIGFFLGFLLIGLTSPPLSAQVGILPTAPENCKIEKKVPEAEVVKASKGRQQFDKYVNGDKNKLREALGCAVKLGRIRLFMVPFFITFIIQFLLSIAGLISVLFMVIGGYRYVIGGLTEDKESGKKTITHALLGLIIALSAWMVINFIQVALTS